MFQMHQRGVADKLRYQPGLQGCGCGDKEEGPAAAEPEHSRNQFTKIDK
jgi:hypothetical protein